MSENQRLKFNAQKAKDDAESLRIYSRNIATVAKTVGYILVTASASTQADMFTEIKDMLKPAINAVDEMSVMVNGLCNKIDDTILVYQNNTSHARIVR